MNMIRNEELEAILQTIDLRDDAPAKEPMRQYYFIKKARELITMESEKLGRRLTADGETFGCQMNAKDSEKLIGILETIGFEMIEDESADWFSIIPVLFETTQTSVCMADWDL